MDDFPIRSVVWRSLDQLGVEICRLEKPKARGSILRIGEGALPFGVRYEFVWRSDFTLCSAKLWSYAEGEKRYTRTARGRYRFESVESGFRAEIECDEHQLVLHYPDLFQREV